MSETCRDLVQKNIEKLVHLIGFIIKTLNDRCTFVRTLPRSHMLLSTKYCMWNVMKQLNSVITTSSTLPQYLYIVGNKVSLPKIQFLTDLTT
jgi:hypothetical protein